MKDGNCTVCKGCGWRQHSNMDFYFSTEMIKETGKAENLYSAFIDNTNKKTKSE
jgi:hypothetical protein